MKPIESCHSCTVSKEIPYSVSETSSKGTQPGVGVLQIGRVIWLDGDLEGSVVKTSVKAYAEGVGSHGGSSFPFRRLLTPLQARRSLLPAVSKG